MTASDDLLEPLGDISLADLADSGEIGWHPIDGEAMCQEAAAIDSGLFSSPGESLAMGHDGDDIGRSHRDQAIGDMLDSGHGFLIRRMDKPQTVHRVTCEVCGNQIPTPGCDPDWLCQCYDETQPASLTCGCSWCLTYQEYLAGRYRPQGGRPRKRCGSKECDRKAKTRAQKQRRLAKRSGGIALPLAG